MSLALGGWFLSLLTLQTSGRHERLPSEAHVRSALPCPALSSEDIAASATWVLGVVCPAPLLT